MENLSSCSLLWLHDYHSSFFTNHFPQHWSSLPKIFCPFHNWSAPYYSWESLVSGFLLCLRHFCHHIWWFQHSCGPTHPISSLPFIPTLSYRCSFLSSHRRSSLPWLILELIIVNSSISLKALIVSILFPHHHLWVSQPIFSSSTVEPFKLLTIISHLHFLDLVPTSLLSWFKYPCLTQ